MCVRPSSDTLAARSEALIRLLRTVLEEARSLVREAPLAEQSAALEETIVRLQREAEKLAPDFNDRNLRNGAARG